MALVERTERMEPERIAKVGARRTVATVARRLGDERRSGDPLFGPYRPNDFGP